MVIKKIKMIIRQGKNQPHFIEPFSIEDAVSYHLKFINSGFHVHISACIRDVLKTVELPGKDIISKNETRFSIGNIVCFAKNGNLYLTIDEDKIHQVKAVADKYFVTTVIERLHTYDEDLTLIIELNSE